MTIQTPSNFADEQWEGACALTFDSRSYDEALEGFDVVGAGEGELAKQCNCQGLRMGFDKR